MSDFKNICGDIDSKTIKNPIIKNFALYGSDYYDKVMFIESKEEENTEKKKPRLVLNKDVKVWNDFIIRRYLWEMKLIEPKDNEECPDDLVSFINDKKDDFKRDCNIAQLIAYTIPIYDHTINDESYDLHKKLINYTNKLFVNKEYSELIVVTMIKFVKILSMHFINSILYEKSRTINIKTFEKVLISLELLIPFDYKTIRYGIIDDIKQFHNLIKEE